MILHRRDTVFNGSGATPYGQGYYEPHGSDNHPLQLLQRPCPPADRVRVRPEHNRLSSVHRELLDVGSESHKQEASPGVSECPDGGDLLRSGRTQMKRKPTMPGGFVVRGNGLFHTGGKPHNPDVLPCRDCDAKTTARCPQKGTPMCSVCKHIQKTRGFHDEPPTARRASLALRVG